MLHLPLLALLGLAATTLAAPTTDLFDSSAITRRTCGTETPPAELTREVSRIAAAAALATFEDPDGLRSTIHAATSIDTYFHVVTSDAANTPTPAQLSDQLAKMNDAYAPSGMSFSLADTDYTTNPAWAAGSDMPGMKGTLRRGSYATLNVYFLTDLANSGSGDLLGKCNFPNADGADPGSDAFIEDGCVVLADTVPGGANEIYNEGATAVHEVGHWFGLSHVFEGQSCTGDGDHLADTPQQSTATSGCPPAKDSCPDQPGLDSVSNYMDYSDDVCLTEFTAGQIAVIQGLWDTYRAGK